MDDEIIATVEQRERASIIHLGGDVTTLAEEAIQQAYQQVTETESGVIALNFRDTDYINSAGNFIMFDVGDAAKMFVQLQRKAVITRPVAGYGFPKHLRVTVGTEEQNAKFLSELECFLND